MKANLYFWVIRQESSVERKPIDEIVAMLPIKPDEVDRVGEQRKNRLPGKLHEQDVLTFKRKGIEVSYIKEEITDFLNAVFPIKPTIDEHLADCRTQLSVACYADGQVNPEVILEPEAVLKLAALNAKFWVDIYCTGIGKKHKKKKKKKKRKS